MRIGFFDSGIGGITVLSEALRQLPHEDYIYYADTLNVPYGVKPKEVVRQYIIGAADFISRQGIKALVVACNTATSIAIEDLRKRYDFPVIGMEPAVKPAVQKCGSENKRVLVLATPLTLKEEKFKNLVGQLDSDNIVDILPFPELVVFAEKFQFDESVVLPVIREKLSDYDINRYGTVVLGCTHFPYYRGMIAKLLPACVDIIDGGAGTVRNLKRVLEERGVSHEGMAKITFYTSGIEVKDPLMLGKYKELLERQNRIGSI